MAHTSTTITAPVATSDPAAVLAVASNNIGYLCSNKHGKINPWSKYKPVILAILFPDRSGDWWRGADKRCGLTPIYTTNYREIPGMYTDALKKGWTYNPPTGGNAAPFRIGDFSMYFHAAMPPFQGVYCTEKACPGKTFEAGMASNRTGGTGYPTSITLADIADHGGGTLSDYYFGVILTDSAGNYKHRMTSDTAGTDSIRITLPTSGYVQGQTYKAYPFLSKKKMGFLDADTATDNLFYPLPCVDPVSFRVVSAEEYAGISIDISGQYTIGKTGAQIEVKVTSAAATTISGTIYVRHTPVGISIDANDVTRSVASQSLAANTTTVFPVRPTDRVVSLAEEYYGQYFIHVVLTIGGVVYSKTGYLRIN